MGESLKFCPSHEKIEAKFEFMCERFKYYEDTSKIKFNAMHESILIAKEEMDRRLEGMNEFRTQLTAQANTFMPKREVELLMDKYDTRLKHLENISLIREGGSTWRDSIVTAIIAATIVLLIHFFFKF